MTREQLAERFAALAVEELAETMFPACPPRERAALYQRLRAPVLAAVLGYAATVPPPRRPPPEPSPN